MFHCQDNKTVIKGETSTKINTLKMQQFLWGKKKYPNYYDKNYFSWRYAQSGLKTSLARLCAPQISTIQSFSLSNILLAKTIKRQKKLLFITNNAMWPLLWSLNVQNIKWMSLTVLTWGTDTIAHKSLKIHKSFKKFSSLIKAHEAIWNDGKAKC